MLVIPAIDIYDEKIVRLTKGDFDNITYYKNTPVQQAQLYESFGFKLVHVVDLAGSKTGKLTSLESVKKIKSLTKLEIEFGGGIRDVKSVADILSAGADYAIVGSLSIKNKTEFEIIINEYSSSKIIAAIDVMDEKLRISGWTESTSVSVFSHIEYCSKLGIQKYLCTDISKDGTLIGTNVDLYKKIMDKFPNIKLIASGGVKDIEEIKMLNKLNLYGVVVGKAIYENKIDLKELAKFAV
jgi:phosphoribosylformimino-5-aminoimidazole carboxamide ribotide isomerase